MNEARNRTRDGSQAPFSRLAKDRGWRRVRRASRAPPPGAGVLDALEVTYWEREPSRLEQLAYKTDLFPDEFRERLRQACQLRLPRPVADRGRLT